MTAAAFALFLAGLAACLAKGWNVAWALTGGLCLFFLLGLYRGFSPGALCAMAWRKGKTSMVVVRILLLIGAITGLWRAGGTGAPRRPRPPRRQLPIEKVSYLLLSSSTTL